MILSLSFSLPFPLIQKIIFVIENQYIDKKKQALLFLNPITLQKYLYLKGQERQALKRAKIFALGHDMAI